MKHLVALWSLFALDEKLLFHLSNDTCSVHPVCCGFLPYIELFLVLSLRVLDTPSVVLMSEQHEFKILMQAERVVSLKP